MKRNFLSILILLCAGTVAPAPAAPGAASPAEGPAAGTPGHRGWRSVEKILGQCGTVRGNALQLAFPRTDLNVVVRGIPLQPAMGLTSRVSFQALARGSEMTGELVLLDQEVPQVLAQLARDGDLEVSALQHPFLYESPAIEILRITGRGSRTRLAGRLKSLLAATGTPLNLSGPGGGALSDSAAPLSSPPVPSTPGTQPTAASRPGPGSAGQASGKGPDWSRVESILGKGDVQGGVWTDDLPPFPTAAGGGAETADSAGMNSYLRFQQSGGQVAAAGELVLTGGLVNPVIEALTRHGATVTAINSPLDPASSRVFFLRFWALGDAAQVAEGLRAALDAARQSSPK